MPGRLRRQPLTRIRLERRRVCAWLLLPALQCVVPARAQPVSSASARLWPAQEYTRLIVESPAALTYRLVAMKHPERLVLDLESVDLNAAIMELPRHVVPNDPYVEAIRVAQFRPGIVRIVLDLKTEVNPQLFGLSPVG